MGSTNLDGEGWVGGWAGVCGRVCVGGCVWAGIVHDKK
jgi:hypothetical protein